MTHPEQGTDLGTYELRVHGHLGPLLLSALPHAAASRVPGHTLLIVERSEDRDLVDILQQVVAAGLEVESVRETTETTETTSPG